MPTILLGIATVISAIAGIGASLYSASQQFEAGDEAERIAERNAAMKRAETEEEARRLEDEQEFEEGLAKARAFASGIDPTSGSVAGFLREIEDRNRSELMWLKRTGESEAISLKEQGDFAKEAARTSGFSSIGEAFSFMPDFVEGGRMAKWWT